jgi:hypothetical protein
MNGHVKGPLVMGQKVRVTLDGSIERSDGAWEVFCGGYSLPLDLDGIVSLEFIDSDESKTVSGFDVCGSEYVHPGRGSFRCDLPKNHGKDWHRCGSGLAEVQWAW